MTDPIVEEVHRAREAIAKRFDNDLSATCAGARKRQAASARKPRRLPPRPAPTPTTKRKSA